MPIENIGTCRNQAEALRAIRFLGRCAGLPIGFFGIRSAVTVREVPGGTKTETYPIVTLDVDACEAGGYRPTPEMVTTLTGAMGAFLTMSKRHPIRKRPPMTTIHPMAAR